MALHKARVKTVEELEAEGRHCCDWARNITSADANTVIVIDLADTVHGDLVCKGCQHVYKNTLNIRVRQGAGGIRTGILVPIKYFDIDEGIAG